MTTPTDSQRNAIDLLNHLQRVARSGESVSIDAILDQLGRRSFGPIILTIGAFLSIPGPSDIPTVPSILGIIIIVIAVQMLFRREHIWLPAWVLRKNIKSTQLDTVIKRLRKPAAWVDTIIRPRFSVFASRAANVAVAVVCIGLSLLTPVMELIPFSANVAGFAFVCFGLGLVAKDGLMNILGFTFCSILIGVGIWIFF